MPLQKAKNESLLAAITTGKGRVPGAIAKAERDEGDPGAIAKDRGQRSGRDSSERAG